MWIERHETPEQVAVAEGAGLRNDANAVETTTAHEGTGNARLDLPDQFEMIRFQRAADRPERLAAGDEERGWPRDFERQVPERARDAYRCVGARCTLRDRNAHERDAVFVQPPRNVREVRSAAVPDDRDVAATGANLVG